MWTPRSLLSRLTPALMTPALLALSLPAAAGSKFDQWTGSVGEAAINGVVEVPLYTADPLKSVPMVYGQIKEEQPAVGFTLATGLDIISISSETAEKMGLEVKSANKKLINVQKWTVNKKISEDAIKAGTWKEGGAFKYVEIPSIKIGDLELKDVVAFVHPGEGQPCPFPKGNYIGLGALDKVAWSITPSDGKVRFAPAAQGATLLDKVGGTRLNYEEAESSFEKVGKSKVYVPGLSHQVQATVGGKSIKSTLATTGSSAVLDSVDIEKQTTRKNGDEPIHWTTVSLGDSQINSTWVAQLTPPETETPWQYKFSVIGSDVLSHYDIAGDPATHTLALKPASAHNRLDPRPITVESRIKSAEEKDKKAQEAAKDSKDGKPAKPDGAAWSAVAKAYSEAGQYGKAIEVLQGKVLAADDKDCSTWQDLGDAQQNNGQLAEAATSYGKAADLYHAWWDRPRKQREELSELVEKAKGDGLETYVGEDGKPVYPQAGACHTADGQLAGVYIAERQFGKVEELYRKHLDLDAGLAIAWGNAALVSGQWEKVQEPYRQALRREESWDALPRMGLALAYQQKGDWDTAQDLYRTVLDLSPNDSVAAAAWLDGLRAAKGKDAAITAAREWVKQNPTSAAARYALVRELSLAGDATGLQALTTSTDAWFARKLAVDAYDLRVTAVYARYLVLTGRADEAQKVLDKSQAADSGNAHLWVARADLLKARGDTAEALKAARKAAALNPANPGYALLLNAPQN